MVLQRDNIEQVFELCLILFSLVQHDDKYHPGGYNQYPTVSEHDQVLERTTRDLCHTKVSGGACQECTIPQTSTHCRHFLFEMGAKQKSEENQTLIQLTKIVACQGRDHPLSHLYLFVNSQYKRNHPVFIHYIQG